MEWQPIETAPKDGSVFLGWNNSHGMHECHVPDNVSHYKRLTAIYGCGSSFSKKIWFTPTHWMPLPNPPT